MNIPEWFYDCLRALNPNFITTLFPDAANGIPSEIFDHEIAQAHINKAHELIDWIREVFKPLRGWMIGLEGTLDYNNGTSLRFDS